MAPVLDEGGQGDDRGNHRQGSRGGQARQQERAGQQHGDRDQPETGISMPALATSSAVPPTKSITPATKAVTPAGGSGSAGWVTAFSTATATPTTPAITT